MAFNLDNFDQQFGTSTTHAAGNTDWNSGAPAATPKAPSFWNQVGSSLKALPGEAAGLVMHSTVDPFAHLLANAGNAISANSNAQSAADASKQLDQQSKQAQSDFAAGHISRQQYIEKVHAITQAAQGQAQATHDQTVKSISQMAPDAASAALTALTLGAGALPEGLGKAAVQGAVEGVAGKTAGTLAGKAVGAGADLIGAGKGIGSNVVTQLPGKLARNAALVQPTAQFAGQTVNDVKSGNVKGALGDAALWAAPAGLALAGRGIKAVAPTIKDAFFGKSATLTDALGVNRVNQYLAENANNADNIAKLKRIELFTQNQPAVQSGKITPGEFLKQHMITKMDLNPATTPVQKLIDNMDIYARNHAVVEQGVAAGLLHPDTVLTHSIDSTIPSIAKDFAQHGDTLIPAATRVQMVNEALDRMNIQNMTLRDKIGSKILSAGNTGNEIAAALSDMKGKPIIPTPEGLKIDSGYSLTYGPHERAQMPTLKEAKAAGMPVVGSDPHGVLGEFGKGLDKLGLGLRTTSPTETSNAIAQNLEARLVNKQIDVHGMTGKQVMSALYEETRKTAGVYDPRLLRATEGSIAPNRANVQRALGVSASTAKAILKEVKGAFGDVPLGTRSAGEKMTDKLIQHLSPMSTYLKAMGYGRFSANPLFWVKQGTKSEYIGLLEAGGKPVNLGQTLNSFLGTAPKEDTIGLLKGGGYTSKAASAGGESDFFGNLAPELNSRVSSAQVGGYIQQSMGQAAEQFAKNNGTTVRDILDPKNESSLKPQFNHLMEMIVGYPKGANYLNSNLAKSLNVLVFPSRFETKVGVATAKYFLQQPKIVQLSIVNSMLRANAWANSPEGTAWTQKNADLVGIINYFSPTHTLSSIASFAKSGSLGDLGNVGGMPVGVITTILNHQGVPMPDFIAGNDMNPATGQPYTNKIPQGSTARVQQGVTDLIGSMFSYPGASIGMPSKTSTIQNYVPGLKINPANQKTVGAATTATPAPASKAKMPTSFNAPSVPQPTTTAVRTNIAPAAPRAKKAKVYARPPH